MYINEATPPTIIMCLIFAFTAARTDQFLLSLSYLRSHGCDILFSFKLKKTRTKVQKLAKIQKLLQLKNLLYLVGSLDTPGIG